MHHVHTVFHNALAQALEWGYVPINVSDRVKPPALPQKELRYMGWDMGLHPSFSGACPAPSSGMRTLRLRMTPSEWAYVVLQLAAVLFLAGVLKDNSRHRVPEAYRLITERKGAAEPE